MSDLKQTDLSKRLREAADSHPMWKKALTDAANEIEHYYTGMLNWKATAEAQDRTQPSPDAETYLRERYGAYRGHPEWRALEEAFNAGRRTQPEATAPAPEQRIADALAELASAQKPLDADVSKIIFDNMWALYGDEFGAKIAPAQPLYAANAASTACEGTGPKLHVRPAAPAQDLSAAILAMDCPDTSHYGVSKAVGYEQAWDECRRAAAALASSANALSAGDRVDADIVGYVDKASLEWLNRRPADHGAACISLFKSKEPIDAVPVAILQSQKGGSDA